MRFADVAMENATLGGRRSLEEVLAVEVLTGRGVVGGCIDEGRKQRGGRNSSINIEYGSAFFFFFVCTFCSDLADERCTVRH